MCYHNHYMFLHCGHSVSSVRPVHPSPPCPHQPQPAKPVKTRAFSFDPSVIASTPVSPLRESLSARTPWRLETPFNTSAGLPPGAGEGQGDVKERRERRSSSDATGGNVMPRIADDTSISKKAHSQQDHQQQEHEAAGTQQKRTHINQCGEILVHPYRTYKLESLCLNCRRKRDTRLASFEATAIRNTVYRESGVNSRNGRRMSRGPSPSQWLDGKENEILLEAELAEKLILETKGSLLVRGDHGGQWKSDGVGTSGPSQQQQTPWRLTLPPAQVPRTARDLAGMRDGEWI